MISPSPIGVALVEDEPAYRDHLMGLVNRTGCFRCVGAVASGEAALAEFPGWRPQLALVDLELPGMGGLRLIAKLRAQFPDLDLAVVTQHDDDARLFAALEAGAVGYLTKPVEPDQLLGALMLLHEGGTPMSAGIARRVLQSFRQHGTNRDEMANLSAVQRQLLRGVAEGLSRKEIATEFGISLSAVFQRQRAICKLLHVDSIRKAAAKLGDARPSAVPPR